MRTSTPKMQEESKHLMETLVDTVHVSFGHFHGDDVSYNAAVDHFSQRPLPHLQANIDACTAILGEFAQNNIRSVPIEEGKDVPERLQKLVDAVGGAEKFSTISSANRSFVSHSVSHNLLEFVQQLSERCGLSSVKRNQWLRYYIPLTKHAIKDPNAFFIAYDNFKQVTGMDDRNMDAAMCREMATFIVDPMFATNCKKIMTTFGYTPKTMAEFIDDQTAFSIGNDAYLYVQKRVKADWDALDEEE